MVAEIKGGGTQSVAQAAVPADTAVRQVAGATPIAPAKSGAPSDVVTLTDLAARLQRLTEALDKVPVVDQAKVAALREEIESGGYRVDGRQIADKLTALEALLDGAKKG